MPNCDWNRPCDCRDCREIIETHVCPSCQFPNKVSVIRNAYWEEDKKHGGGYYLFVNPKTPVKDLICYECGDPMKEVGYYTSIHEDFCKNQKERAKLIKDERYCVNCDKLEELDFDFYGRVKLTLYNQLNLCRSCLIDAVKVENPDPSNATNKFKFDPSKLIWALYRVKVTCTTCESAYWVNSDEQSWRKQCKKCYGSKRGKKTESSFP
ncbi:hypothetical protein [Paenibacillus sp. GbtcB18]|uniref:hypothetical protein n=1 Tax=Paenibacillus sp. GbtcB18 TaxID=2824763 RepID=UPI001C2F3BD2|nr:hypothetical protein [Paenibacillus sp. GbtcB18]